MTGKGRSDIYKTQYCRRADRPPLLVNKVTVSEAFQQANRRLLHLVLAWIMFSLLLGAGLLALIIPGFYILYRLVFSLSGTVLDNVSALDSLSNSWELTKGRWWLVFRSSLLISIVVFVPVIAIALLIDPKGQSLQAQLASSVLGFLAGPLMGVYIVLLYRRLRDSVATIQ